MVKNDSNVSLIPVGLRVEYVAVCYAMTNFERHREPARTDLRGTRTDGSSR